MIEMLKTLDSYLPASEILAFEHLHGEERDLLDSLLSERKPIAFYFAPIDDFGLSDTLYVRMNARGKLLTSFEKFKSEFYTLLGSYKYVNEFKDRMEYGWVTNLWPYRAENVFVTDTPFLNMLEFVTMMLYHGQRKRTDKADESRYNDVLQSVYSHPENIDFLAFSLEALPYIEKLLSDNSFVWRKKDNTITAQMLTDGYGKLSIPEMMVLYAAIVFLFKHHRNRIEFIAVLDDTYIKNYLRVVRNLIVNTSDNSNREWPHILQSIDLLAANEDVYSSLISPNLDLKGFYKPQVSEEIYKAKQIVEETDSRKPLKNIISSMEDNDLLQGNIKSLLTIAAVKTAKEFDNVKLDDTFACPSPENLEALYGAYQQITIDDANEIWGNLIDSALYYNDGYRVTYDGGWKKNFAIVREALRFQKSGKTLKDYIRQKQDDWLKNIMKKTNGNPWSERDPKKQLQLYYILTVRCLKRTYDDFFDGKKNFGWLWRTKGYKSLFENGIEKAPEYPANADWLNPIFQRYSSQFRYNCGINRGNTFELEIVDMRVPRQIDEWLASFTDKS